MNAVPFDPLKLARGFEAAGLAPPVAAGTAAAPAEAMEAALAEAMESAGLATKSDLAMVKSRIIESRIVGAVGTLGARFDTRLEPSRRDMKIKPGGIIFIATGVLLAAMPLMPRP